MPNAAGGARTLVVVAVAAAVLTTAGCGAGTPPTPTTGLTGTVERGPVTPVCNVNLPCNAPFSAGFTVTTNGAVVAHFRSDGAGHFTVMVPPAVYQVIPDADAPLLAPTSQVKTVSVQGAGLTSVTLEFDTGLR